MAYWLNHRSTGVWLATLCSAVLFWFGTGLHPIWPLTWLAPVPVLIIAVRYTVWQTAIAAFAAWLIGSFNLWTYLHGLIGLPVIVLALRGILSALVFTAAILLFRWLLRRGAVVSAIFSLPAVCVSFEYLVNLTSSLGTATCLAYTQLNFLPFLQLASITGPWGMSFLLMGFPAALVSIGHLYGKNRQQSMILAGAAGAVMIAVIGFGIARLSSASDGSTVKVGLAASDAPGNDDIAAAGQPVRSLLQAYTAQAANLAAAGAKVIVLPEKIGDASDGDSPASDSALLDFANQSGVPVIAGLVTGPGRKVGDPTLDIQFNAARVYRPHAPTLEYHKEHMLPQFESKFTPGTALTVLPTAWGNWGVAICKDMDFTDLSSRYGRVGVGLLLVPGWDFDVDWLFHGHIAVMRAVENGFSLVRAAKNGSLFATDNRGRVLAEVRTDSAPFVTLVVDVPVKHSATLYQRFGNWFAGVALGLLIWSIAQIWHLRKR